VIVPWTIGGLLNELTARGGHPAVIAFREDGVVTWGSEALAEKALSLARGLREHGVDKGSAVALWAPNSPVWIAAALGVLAAGGMLVPIDDLADSEQLEAALNSSGARLIFTTARHFEASGAILRARDATAICIDEDPRSGLDGMAWQALTSKQAEALPVPVHNEPAMLSWTSGTTGSPKAFILTHRNIATNVEALQKMGVAGPRDRALLPLPLHHAYPFVVGMLTTLSLGTTIALPGGTTGSALMRALREANVTTIVGVPRLYEALWAAIEVRLKGYHLMLRPVFGALLKATIFVQQSSGTRLGRFLFAPIRHALAPRLRLLVSGGARLKKETEEQLEALGWTVLSGYGLAETASLFTGNRPNDRRLGSAGRPLADGEIRVARPDDQGIGEIELHGSSITKGYLNNPEANQAAFTADRWFRTGDLGFTDPDGFLFITGRTKEVLVLGGGKKVIPEDLERIYGAAPEISEIAVLEDRGTLVALVRPDAVKLRQQGATNLRDGVRVILGEQAQHLPSYERLSGFALTDQPLPRTRLGKYRRFLLPMLYAQAAAGAGRHTLHALTPGDAQLLRDPTADAVWTLLRQRYPNQALDLDINLSLDLNLDSFAWMELTILLQDRLGIHLLDADIAEIETIRDLLRLSIERRTGVRPLRHEEPAIALDIARWLAPTATLLTASGFLLYALNRLLMRGLFRLRCTGVESLPETGPFVITPNHVSYLDGFAIAAALPWHRLQHVYWAGGLMRLFSSPLSRLFSRAVHLFPVDSRHPGAALEIATRVLSTGNVQIWFPEGWRSPDGSLQRFLPGIGQLLLRSGAPAVPAYIAGTFDTLPRSRRIPKFHRITVSFGRPEPVASCVQRGSAEPTKSGLSMRCASALLLSARIRKARPVQLSSLISLPILSAVRASKPNCSTIAFVDLHQRRTCMSASLWISCMENMMRDVQISRPVRRVQTHGSSLVGLALILLLGLALLSTGCAQPDQAYPLTLSQDHVRLPSLAPVVQAVMPAVVHVSAVQRPGRMSVGEEGSIGLSRSKHRSSDRGLPPAALDELLRRFFGMPQTPIKSTGSGFIIYPDGYIVTEDHVVENAEKVTVTLQEEEPRSARIIGRDPKTDLALLKIDADHPLPYVGWGDSGTARVGDWVVAIGNPFGLDATVSSGIISGRGRDMHLGSYDDFLQIDAAINLGNSGGPTFDLNGQVIGINTAIYSPNTGSVGIGFAVPANLAQPVIAQLKARGKVERGWLGVRIQDLTSEIAQSFGLAKAEGGLVADVTADGPAARAGFAQGDVILSVNGQIIGKKRDLLLTLAAMPIGQKAEVRVWRQNAEIVLWPVIGEMPGNPQIAAIAPRESRTHGKDFIIGLNLAPLTEARRELLEIPRNIKGVIVLSIDDDSAFLGFGIRPGDVIESINQQPVNSPEEAIAVLRRALASEQNSVLMLINRHGANRYLAMSLANKPNTRDDG
jgi:long-chain acyl-CoA synthetase